jgi:hypothetical protein
MILTFAVMFIASTLGIILSMMIWMNNYAPKKIHSREEWNRVGDRWMSWFAHVWGLTNMIGGVVINFHLSPYIMIPACTLAGAAVYLIHPDNGYRTLAWVLSGSFLGVVTCIAMLLV